MTSFNYDIDHLEPFCIIHLKILYLDIPYKRNNNNNNPIIKVNATLHIKFSKIRNNSP